MKEIEQFFESFKPVQQFCITLWAWITVNLDIGWASTFVALMVLLFQLKVVYYTGKLKKIEYDKACQGQKDMK